MGLLQGRIYSAQLAALVKWVLDAWGTQSNLNSQARLSFLVILITYYNCHVNNNVNRTSAIDNWRRLMLTTDTGHDPGTLPIPTPPSASSPFSLLSNPPYLTRIGCIRTLRFKPCQKRDILHSIPFVRDLKTSFFLVDHFKLNWNF